MADRRQAGGINGNKSQYALPHIEAKNGMFVVRGLQGKRYLKVMDIRPIPFYTLPVKERNRIVDGFEEWIRIAPSHWGVYATTSDTNKEELCQYVRENTLYDSEKVILERNKYIDWIKTISKADTVSRKLYLVFEYEPDEDEKAESEAEIALSLEEQASIVEGHFSMLGLSRIQHQSGENHFLGDILYRYLNRKTASRFSFERRSDMMVRDATVLFQRADQIDPRNFYAPTSLDTRNGRFLMMDGLYYTYLYLKPMSAIMPITAGWMDRFTSFGSNVSVSITFERMNREFIQSRLKQSNRINRSMNRSTFDYDSALEREGVMENNSYIVRQIAGGQDIWSTVIVMSVCAPSLKDLMSAKRKVIKELRMIGFMMGECQNRMYEGMLMTLPILHRDRILANYAEQQFLTEAAASTFMFTDFVIDDPNGAIVAIDANGKLVSLNPFYTDTHNNANGIVVGTSGSGKTYAMNTMLRHLRLSGVKIRLILPIKGRGDYLRSTNSVDGEFISLVPGGEACINLFEIRPEDEADESLLLGDSYTRRSLLSKKISEIKVWLNLRSRNTITEDQMNEIDAVLIEMYRRFGISTDNTSVFEFVRSGKPHPTFGDFYDIMKGNALLEPIRRSIRPFTEGTYRNLNGQTNVDLENKWIAFDVDKSICGDMLPEYYFIAMSICAADAHRSILENVILFYDEVQNVTRNAETAKYVDEQYATLRAFGAGIWCATQEVGKLAQVENGELSKTILSNAATKIVLKTDPSETESLGKQLRLTPQEMKYIEKPPVGHGLILTGGNHSIVRFQASEEEFWIFNTDPSKEREHAKKIEEKKRKEQELIWKIEHNISGVSLAAEAASSSESK